MKLFNILSVVVFLLSACGKPQSIPTAANPPAQAAAPVTEDPNNTLSPSVSVPPDTTISLNVYSLSKTLIPLSPGLDDPDYEYTAIGYCTQYLSKTYCWDDGLHSVTENLGGDMYTFVNTYWNTWALVVQVDNYLNPTLVTPSFTSSEPSGSVNAVLTTGQLEQVTCDDSNPAVLTCGNFSIEMAQ